MLVFLVFVQTSDDVIMVGIGFKEKGLLTLVYFLKATETSWKIVGGVGGGGGGDYIRNPEFCTTENVSFEQFRCITDVILFYVKLVNKKVQFSTERKCVKFISTFFLLRSNYFFQNLNSVDILLGGGGVTGLNPPPFFATSMFFFNQTL